MYDIIMFLFLSLGVSLTRNNENLTKQLGRVLMMMREVRLQDKPMLLLCVTQADEIRSHSQ